MFHNRLPNTAVFLFARSTAVSVSLKKASNPIRQTSFEQHHHFQVENDVEWKSPSNNSACLPHHTNTARARLF
jgi:hypothetical protein